MGLSQVPPPPPPVSVADAPVSPLALSSSPPHPAATAASAKTSARNRATRLHRAPPPLDPYTSLLTFILPRRAGRSSRRNSARLGVSASKDKFADAPGVIRTFGLVARRGSVYSEPSAAPARHASTVPPCAFVTAATIDSPSPTPPLSRERDSSARRTVRRALPVSGETGARVLHVETAEPSSRPRRTRTAPGRGCARRSQRLSTIWRRRSRSPTTVPARCRPRSAGPVPRPARSRRPPSPRPRARSFPTRVDVLRRGGQEAGGRRRAGSFIPIRARCQPSIARGHPDAHRHPARRARRSRRRRAASEARATRRRRRAELLLEPACALTAGSIWAASRSAPSPASTSVWSAGPTRATRSPPAIAAAASISASRRRPSRPPRGRARRERRARPLSREAR